MKVHRAVANHLATGLALCLAAVLGSGPARADAPPGTNTANAATPASSAEAPRLSARETARVQPERWSYSVGVFNPLTITLWRNLEVQTHPLLFLVAPNATLRVPHRAMSEAVGQWGITGEYGFSVPTLAMRLSQGTLFPAWEQGGGEIGWSFVPHIGYVFSQVNSGVFGNGAVFSARADLAFNLALTHSDAQPLEAPAPLDLVFDPILRRYRGRVGVMWDESLSAALRVRVYGDVYVRGNDDGTYLPSSTDNLTTRLGAGVDLGLGRSLKKRLTLGVAWWNAYQHAIDFDTWEPVRSNDVWPMLDFIWEG